MKYYYVRTCLIILFYMIFSNVLAQFSPDPNSLVAQGEHPRLLLTQSNIPVIRSNIENHFQTVWQDFIDECDSRYSDSNEWYHVYNYGFISRIGLLSGFTYSHTLTEYRSKAIDALTNLSATGNYDSGDWDDVLERDILGLPIGYDWLFDQLSESQKSAIALKIKNDIVDCDFSRHPLNHYKYGTGTAFLGALAIYGDGYYDSDAQTICDKFYTEMVGDSGILGFKDFIASKGGTQSGFSYTEDFGSILFACFEGWRTATDENYFQSSGYFTYFPLYVLYYLQPIPFDDSHAYYPNGKKYFLNQDCHDGSANHAYRHGARLFELMKVLNIHNSDMASLSKWLFENRTGDFSKKYASDKWKYTIWHKFLGYDSTVVAKSPSTLSLPLTYYFEGMGLVIMRSGFDDVDDSYITFKAMPWAVHGGYWSNLNQGHFSIYKYGPLAIQGGGSAHHSYNNSTQGSNCVLFDVPGQDYGVPYSDKGGQTDRAKVWDLNDFIPGSDQDIGGIKRFKFEANQYDYIFADITRAYSGPETPSDPTTSPEKVELFTRELVYMRPDNVNDSDYIFVFDRIRSVDAQIKKRWMLHMSYEPLINGTPQTVSNWETKYQDADEITITNNFGSAHGRLFVKTLLPENVDIHKIGGIGYEFIDITGNNDDNGFTGYTTSSSPLDDASAYFAGRYKIEVRPQSQQQDDIFFHVFQTADANTTSSMETVNLIDNGDNYFGASIDKFTVLFSKLNQKENYANFTDNSSGFHKYLITDLNSGLYYVRVNGNLLTGQDFLVNDDGVLYFNYTGGGNFNISRSPDFTPPQKPQNIKIKP